MDTVFFRLMKHDDKQAALAAAVESLRAGSQTAEVFAVSPSSFEQVPGSPFAYWVSEQVRAVWKTTRTVSTSDIQAISTSPLNEDFRYFRCWWEVKGANIGRKKQWVRLSKGGDFSRYYSNVHMLAAWDDAELTYRGFTGTVNRPLKRPASVDHFFKAGITYSRRSQIGFSARALPEGAIFHDKGPGIFGARDVLPVALGILNSKPFALFLQLQMSFGSYEVGVIQRTPMPSLHTEKAIQIGRLAARCASIRQRQDSGGELSTLFAIPCLLRVSGESLVERIASWQKQVDQDDTIIISNQQQIDSLAFDLYGIEAGEQPVVSNVEAIDQGSIADESPSEEAEEPDKQDPTSYDRDSLVADLIFYFVGLAFGRWDIRFAIDQSLPPALPDPFAPLPICPPGMLTGGDGLPATEDPPAYPLRVQWDGVLVDDPDHVSDIVRHVRVVLELIWKDRADAIEKEACEILGVKELRDYFRKPGKGGLWDDHIARYSKSRRKAPIYWLLQSSKKSYAVWLYCHRIDKDTLFKVLVNTVEPKAKNADRELTELRTRRTTATGKDIKALDRQIEKQDAFVSELRDFEDKLRRAAELNLTPDLNDGVVLTIAPLRELVPWKEAKAYWDELLAGEYAWSSIGKQLREKGLVK